MTEEQVRAAVTAAIERLRREVPVLDFQRVHERSTAHRLAVHMEPLFAPWNVDCEYDRAGMVKKYLQGIAQCDEQRQTDAIVPDIIVHVRRGEGREQNLLVVEMKKDDPEDACDRMKLELFTAPDGDYAYQFGLYINIDRGHFVCTWYRDGRRQ
jgi:hypothetical protein